MTTGPATLLLQRIGKLATAQKHCQMSDRELLVRFSKHRDEAAFAAILQRHGSMVLNVCRRSSRNSHDAEDVFQATFLVLMKKAASLRWRDSVAGWLHEVAWRLASRARSEAARRSAKEISAGSETLAVPVNRLTVCEAQTVLHEELQRLPEKVRAPLVLCYLEGATQDEAARQLGWSLRTLKRRLDRGRSMLHLRLTRRGLTLTSAFSTGLLTASTVSARLSEGTLKAAVAIVTGAAPIGISAGTAALMRGAETTMFLAKLKVALALTVLVGLLSTGVVLTGAHFGLTSNNNQNPQAMNDGQGLKPAAAQETQPATAGKKTPVQSADGPLPPGAIARLGTIRFNHGDRLSSLHYTPDGKEIVSYGGGFLCRWNADTGEEISRVVTKRNRNHFDTHAALLADGKTLIVLTQQIRDQAQFWDVVQGKQTRSVDLDGSRGLVSMYHRNTLSPDGQLVALHTSSGLRVVETTTGKERFWTNRRSDIIGPIIFSGNSKTLIQAGTDGVMEVWDTTTGKPLKIFDQQPPAKVLAVSPDGRWLATLEHHNYAIDKHLDKDFIHLWDLSQPRKAQSFAGKGWFMGIRFTPDSARLLAYSSTHEGYESYGWDIATGAPIPNLLRELAWAKAFHPDGKRFVIAGSTFEQWDSVTGKRLCSSDSRYAAARAVCFDATGKRVFTLGNESLTTWETATGKRLGSVELARYPLWDPRPVFAADGSRAISFRHGMKPYGIKMLVWDVASGKSTVLNLGDPPQKQYANAQHHIQPVFGPNDMLFVRQPGPHKTAMIRVWDLKTGRETRQLPENKAGWSNKTFLLADGKTLVVAGGQAVGLDVDTGKELFAWKPSIHFRSKEFKRAAGDDPNEPPRWRAFAMSPDGKTGAYLLGTDWGSERIPDRIVICDGKTGRVRHRLDDSGRYGTDFEQMLFSPDGRWLASSDGKVAHLWDAATGAKLRTFAHRGEVRAFAFNQMSSLFATASADSTVLIWDLADLRQ